MSQTRSGAPPAVRFEADHALIRIHVTPGAKCDDVALPEADDDEVAFKVRTRARAEDGKANAAVGKLIADHLGLAKSRIAVKSGGKSRLKVLRIEGTRLELAPLLSR